MEEYVNILQVCSAASLGGGERHVIDLTRALIERGHNLHLAIRPGSPLRAPLAGWPVTFHELPLRNSIDLQSIWRLARLIRHERIQVLHAHVGRDYIVCGLAARLNPDVRYLITRHHFNPFRPFWPYRANPLLASAFARADHLIAVSSTVYQRIAAAVPHLEARIRLVPNWVDPTLFSTGNREQARRTLGITRSLAIGIIGQISSLKGQHIFVEAALELLDGKHIICPDVDLPPDELEFLVIGAPAPGDEPYAAALQDRVTKAGRSASIRFSGFIEDLHHHLAGLDLVVILSENEAFSLVLVESMAAGLPVISTRVGGLAEILSDQQTGLFIDRSAAALSAAIIKLARDPELRQQFAVRARQEVQQRFSRETVITRIERLLTASATPDPAGP
jgi:glycosyltransferase involved in cell wall biosynthesis